MASLELRIPAQYPAAVRDALRHLGEALWPHAAAVAALVVYGSVARGEAAASSDINLAIVLRVEDMAATLDALRRPLRQAFRASRIEPFLLHADELPRLCDVFPVKLLDIQAHHDCIYGEDPFPELTIAWPDLRYRVEQELRNLEMRMRRFYLFRGDDAQQLGEQIDHSLSALGVAFEGLVRLEAGALALPRMGDMLIQAGKLLDADPALMTTLATHRSTGVPRSAATERVLYLQLMNLLRRAVTHVDRLEPPQ